MIEDNYARLEALLDNPLAATDHKKEDQILYDIESSLQKIQVFEPLMK